MGPTPPLNVRPGASGRRSHCRESAIYEEGKRRTVACCICCEVLANGKIRNTWNVYFFLIGRDLAQPKLEKSPWLGWVAALLILYIHSKELRSRVWATLPWRRQKEIVHDFTLVCFKIHVLLLGYRSQGVSRWQRLYTEGLLGVDNIMNMFFMHIGYQLIR